MQVNRMDWSKLMGFSRLADQRKNYDVGEMRSAFQRDFDRIVFSSAFRRLQDKTQVFPVPASDFVHSRLTHSIEVSSVARSLGNMAGSFILEEENTSETQFLQAHMFGDICAAAALAHDVGNPPFGHSGEDAIADFFKDKKSLYKNKMETEAQWADLTRYEGNAQGFRLLANHHPQGIDGGLRLCHSTLAVFAKYPRASFVPSDNLIEEDFKRTSSKKFNFFQSDYKLFKEVADATGLMQLNKENAPKEAWCRHPLSFLVEAADNICYRLIDLEDGYKLGYMDFGQVENLLMPFIDQSRNPQQAHNNYNAIIDEGEKIGYLRALSISQLIFEAFEVFKENYPNIISGRFDQELTDLVASKELLNVDIKKANIFLYNRKSVVEIEITGNRIIQGLLEIYLEAQMGPATAMNKKLLQLLPQQFQLQKSHSIYDKLLITSDYIARMSDSYALNLYRRISGQSLPLIG